MGSVTSGQLRPWKRPLEQLITANSKDKNPNIPYKYKIDIYMDNFTSGSPFQMNLPDLPNDLVRKVASMERRRNWNHRGAKAILAADCQSALALIRNVISRGGELPTHVGPSPKGRVGISWRFGDNLVYAEASSGDGAGVYYQWGGTTGEAKEGWVDQGTFVGRLVHALAKGPIRV
jgi:hypothetical protein